MQLFCNIRLIICFMFLLSQTTLSAQHLAGLIPINTATHTAVQNGSWFDPATWDVGTVPGDAAIVVVPMNVTVSYERQSTAHIFAIRVDGIFNATQSNSNQISILIFDTFIGTNTSAVRFKADALTDGAIEVEIKAFDIEAHKLGTSGFAQIWNANAINHFSDGQLTYEVTYNTGPDDRFNSYGDALLGNTTVTETSRTLINDGAGVLGRYLWDPSQLSIGLIVMGELEIIGQEKTNMIKLGADALRNQSLIELSTLPMGWEVGDSLIVSSGGNFGALANGEDLVEIQNITGTTITCTNNLNKNHEGRAQDNLHCYVGNLSRNIRFRSAVSTVIHQRGHLMAMHNPTNVQIRNAAFVDMGRTNKSKLLDDFLWANWVQPRVFNSKISALGQECSELSPAPVADVTNPRGRYSIHLHRTGANQGDNMVHVTGNVVWGNPGWGITHHDSHADVSRNVVYDVTGAGIVSESGSETGFWDDNLVVNIKVGHSTSPYPSVLFYDDYLYTGQGLGMKGRAVVCRGNVIANANQGVGIMNMNPTINHLDRVDPGALATTRPNYLFDQFPLCSGGYSKEGNGIMPVEVALIFENTTIINSYQGLRSIERDMGVNHESRSVFDGFIAWGINQGLSIVYQADYSFKDVFISGRNVNSIGMFLWKHSHNHVFENIKLVDLGYAVTVSKLVEASNGSLKTRNNGFTPWYFVNLVLENVGVFYQIEKENPNTATVYDEHSDNPIHLSSTELTNRPTTFTILDSLGLMVDYNIGDFRFEIDGIITDDLGSYDMGIKQAWAQGNLRLDYPTRIYEFASQQKFEDYLSAHGVYKDTANNDQLYFIINEVLPNRRTYQYTTFPIRVKIINAPLSGIFASAQIEPPVNFTPKNHLISRFASVTQSSTNSGITYSGAAIDAGAWKAIDGNNNGRINAQIYQQGLVPVGSFSETNIEQEPWYDLDLGETKVIDFIDVWNTVGLNGVNIETLSPHFQNFYVLISDSAFTPSMTLSNARLLADYEYFKGGGVSRKFSLDNLNALGRYVRIQAVGTTKIAHAEVEIIGRSLETVNAILPIDWLAFEAKRLDRGKVQLDWITSAEINNKGFEIERMLKYETAFSKVGWVDAEGTTTETQYEFVDQNSYQGISYYRLKQIDFDQKSFYSKVRAVRGIGGTDQGISIYPNPVDKKLSIDLGEGVEGAKKAAVSIFDASGQLVYNKSYALARYQLLTISFLDDFPAGFYLLSIKLDNGEHLRKQFIKE